MNLDVAALRDRTIRVPLVLAAITVLGQILWVLVPTTTRPFVTMTTVVTYFLATATHAFIRRGAAWTIRYLVITIGIGWLVEAVGIATGWPFGDYHYTDTLGPQILGVTWLIPLAWSMMAYPCLLAAQRLATRPLPTIAIGAVCFAAWDLFLDPQMVGEGYWVWHSLGVTLPGIDNIPAQNFAGWLLVALVLMAALERLPRVAGGEEVPIVLLSWTYCSNVMAAAVFFGRPAVALWGAVAMGVVVVPWWRRLVGA